MNKERSEEEKLEAHAIYKNALNIIESNNIPVLLGGAFALKEYSGVARDTKDLDIFCKTTDYEKILKLLAANGFRVEITDARWLSKAFKGEVFIDIIFNSVNNLCQVDDSWFENSIKGQLYDMVVNYVSPEELFWCKVFVQNRERYDGADLNHIILKYGKRMDWKRVMMRLDQHWHLLLAQFLQFQFVDPADRDIVPKWLFEELLERAKDQYSLPPAVEKVCRGPLLDQIQYTTDIVEWGYKIITIKTL